MSGGRVNCHEEEWEGVIYTPGKPRSQGIEPFEGVEIEIHNQTNASVSVLFIDYDGSSDSSFGSISAGGAMALSTYVGHMWLVQLDDATQRVLLEIFVHRKRGGIFEEVPSSGGVLRYVVSDIDPTDSTRVRYGAWQRVPNRTLREREGRSMFEDRDFATADASINTSGREPVVIGWEDEEEAWHWHRLTDLACFSRTPVMFDEVEPADIGQGMLGDCWLLSSLACLAEFPDLVKALLVEGDGMTDLDVGKATFRLFDSAEGTWVHVTVDDFVPTLDSDETPCFARPTNGQSELWVPLLEKALAKFVGAYNMLDGGLPIVALSCLTGEVKGHYVWCRDQKWSITSGSVQSIRESQRLVAESAGLSSMFRGSSETKRLTEDELWGFMLRADESGWLITASSAGMSDDDIKDGIVQAHAYSIIEIREFPEHRLRLIRTRNPWGATEWKGDWSDVSPLWDSYPDVRDALKPKMQEDDGEFWMTLGDWQKYFIGLDGPPGQEGYMQVLETGASEKGTLRSILGQGSLSTIKKNRLEKILTGADRAARVLLGGAMKGALASLGTINRLGGASVEQISRIGPMAIHQLKRLKIGSMGREKKIKSKRTESLSQLRPKVSRKFELSELQDARKSAERISTELPRIAEHNKESEKRESDQGASVGGGSQHGSRVNGIGDSQASRGQEKTLRGGGEGTGDRIDNEDGDLVKVKEGTGCCSVM